jgi:hypothetical protein
MAKRDEILFKHATVVAERQIRLARTHQSMLTAIWIAGRYCKIREMLIQFLQKKPLLRLPGD